MSANLAHASVELDHARQQVRQAMAHLGAAVNVITTAGPHGRCGITASAVCSVTDSPPTLLVCLPEPVERNACRVRRQSQGLHQRIAR
jgi:flavin reductase (NADH)